MTEDGEKLHVLSKLFLNSHHTTDFIVADNCVFSDDRKTLVHIPEARSVVIPRMWNTLVLALVVAMK